jgi:hypothetical protein
LARRTRSSISSTARLACELLCIAGAQYHIRVGTVLRIEERIAPDRDSRIGLGDLAELHADVALACIRAHRFRERANADLELGCHLIKHRLHDRGHSRHHDCIADPEARRPRHLVEDEIRALGDARHENGRQENTRPCLPRRPVAVLRKRRLG